MIYPLTIAIILSSVIIVFDFPSWLGLGRGGVGVPTQPSPLLRLLLQGLANMKVTRPPPAKYVHFNYAFEDLENDRVGT